MPYQPVPGARGVRQRPLSETMADPKMDVRTYADGSMDARNRPGFWTKALPYLVAAPFAYAGGAAALGALTGGGGAGGAAAAAGAAGAAPATATTAGTVAGGLNVARTGFNWFDLIPTAVDFVSKIGGTKIAANAQDRAQAMADQANREAVAELRRQYDLERSDRQPYRDAGAASLARLSGLLSAGPPGMPESVSRRVGPPSAPPRQVGSGQTALAGLTGGPPVSTTRPVPMTGAQVRMEAPDGTIRDVPADKVDMFERKGARRAA